MSKVALLIDGHEVSAEEGVTILQASRDAGIDIPTLCHHEDLAPYGGCRLCTVEVNKGGRTRFVASCVHQVEDGMVVQTESEEVIEGRKLILELLWARSPGVQVLREYGQRYGMELDKFAVSPTNCVLCGLCVRYCAEIKKKNAIGFINRGTEKAVMFYPEIAAKECATCGECFKLCPTGVLPSNYALQRVPHFEWPVRPFSR